MVARRYRTSLLLFKGDISRVSAVHVLFSIHLQDSEFPVDSRVNPQLSHHKGPSAHLTRSGGFRLTHTVSAHALPVSG